MRIVVELGPDGDLPGWPESPHEEVLIRRRFEQRLTQDEAEIVRTELVVEVGRILRSWGIEWTR